MHTQQSAKELLLSYPVKVNFAGFQSDTYTLANQGWDMSMEQQMDPRHGSTSMRLAMRNGNRDNGLYMISHSVVIPYEIAARAQAKAFTYELFMEFMKSLVFEIAYANNNISFQVYAPMRSAGFLRDAFEAVDMTPQSAHVESIRDFKFFKVANPESKELIVDPSKIPEILDLILKCQSVTQAEIRERARSRENKRKMDSGEMFGVKPEYAVQAQLITLVG